MKFKNKTVLITGASSGIGAATAVEFAKEGAKVSLTGRNVANLEKTAKKCCEAGLEEDHIFIVSGDLSKQEDCLSIVDNTIKHFGGLDILVNNAGWYVNKRLMDTSIEDMDSMLNIFVRAVFTMTQRALPAIIENKGAIINVSSIASQITFSHQPSYSVAKCAMDQYTRILALETADKGVRVNSVNPGIVLTNIVGDIESDEKIMGGKTVREIMEINSKVFHPNKKPATPEEVAKAITFLASDEASMITGAFLPVDGGWSLAGPQKEKVEEMSKRPPIPTS